MPDLILGLHGGANSSAAIGAAGHLLYCVQEERLTGEKGYMGFPYRAVAACLQHIGAKPGHVTAIAYGSRFGPVDHCPRDEFLRRLRQVHRRPGTAHAEAHMAEQRCDGMQQKVSGILTELGFTAPVTFHDHHIAHGAAAYYGLRTNPTTPTLSLPATGSATAPAPPSPPGYRVSVPRSPAPACATRSACCTSGPPTGTDSLRMRTSTS